MFIVFVVNTCACLCVSVCLLFVAGGVARPCRLARRAGMGMHRLGFPLPAGVGHAELIMTGARCIGICILYCALHWDMHSVLRAAMGYAFCSARCIGICILFCAKIA